MIVINRRNCQTQLNLTESDMVKFNQFLEEVPSNKIIITEDVDRNKRIEINSISKSGRPVHLRLTDLSEEIQAILNKLIEI